MAAAVRKGLPSQSTTGPRLWVVLARCYGAMAAYVEDRIAGEGLCLSDFMVLEVLLHKGPMPISEIGEKVLLANASMTAAVDRLEKRSFVVRQNSPTDRRSRIVALTAKGLHPSSVCAPREGYRGRHLSALPERAGSVALAAEEVGHVSRCSLERYVDKGPIPRGLGIPHSWLPREPLSAINSDA
jgi:DNA-binding MarR family transcriptional regulator